MNIRLITALALTGTMFFTAPALAEQRPDHFEGKASPTLEAALANLADYNARLATIVSKDTLSPRDFYQIHQLTYTLENALETVGNERARLAALLEEVHIASEQANNDTVKTSGRAYLEGMDPLTR